MSEYLSLTRAPVDTTTLCCQRSVVGGCCCNAPALLKLLSVWFRVSVLNESFDIRRGLLAQRTIVANRTEREMKIDL